MTLIKMKLKVKYVARNRLFCTKVAAGSGKERSRGDDWGKQWYMSIHYSSDIFHKPIY